MASVTEEDGTEARVYQFIGGSSFAFLGFVTSSSLLGSLGPNHKPICKIFLSWHKYVLLDLVAIT